MKELWRLLSGHRPQFMAIAVTEAILGGSEALLHPLLLKAIFDEAVLAMDFGRFLALGGLYLLLGLTLNLGTYWVSWWRKRFENTVVLSLEMELLDRALHTDGRQVAKAGNASYVSRIHNDVREGLLPAIDVSIRLSKQAISSIVFIGVLLYLSWQASLILLLIVPPLVVMSNRLAKKIEDSTEPEREAEAQFINKLTQTLEAFHAIRGMPLLMPGAVAANRAALHGFLGIAFANYRLGLKQRTLSDLVMNLSDTASMIVGAYFVFVGRMSFGGFLAFVNSLWRAVTGILAVINMIPQMRRSNAVLKRIQLLRSSRTATYHDEGPVVLIHDAHVAYADGAYVHIDAFELRAGEHVLLRGPNGSGKTTLMHIIAGTLTPDTGLVTLPPRVASLTAPVMLPPQPVGQLVHDENLRASMGLAGLAGQLPSELSSGQRQKAGVAALLCENADVYLIDEPFANLDEDGKALVLRVVEERTIGRSLLVIHHGDEELDARFDRVVTLQAAEARS